MYQLITNVELISSTLSLNDCLNIQVLIRYSSFGIVTQLWAGSSNSNSRKKREIRLFVKVLKPALGPAHLPTQRVPAYLSPEVQQKEYEHEHSSVSSAELQHT